MDEKEQDNVAAFDMLFTTNQIQIMKTLLPCFDRPMQKYLAIYIKYQELQYTLEKIKLRMGRLEKIEGFYKQVEDGLQKDKMYEYFLDCIEVDILAEEIKGLEDRIVHDNFEMEKWNKEISRAKKEKEEPR